MTTVTSHRPRSGRGVTTTLRSGPGTPHARPDVPPCRLRPARRQLFHQSAEALRSRGGAAPVPHDGCPPPDLAPTRRAHLEGVQPFLDRGAAQQAVRDLIHETRRATLDLGQLGLPLRPRKSVLLAALTGDSLKLAQGLLHHGRLQKQIAKRRRDARLHLRRPDAAAVAARRRPTLPADRTYEPRVRSPTWTRRIHRSAPALSEGGRPDGTRPLAGAAEGPAPRWRDAPAPRPKAPPTRCAVAERAS